MDIDQKRRALGEAIRQRRESQGLSQDRLAKMVGSSKSHIWRIEKGHVGVGIAESTSAMMPRMSPTIAAIDFGAFVAEAAGAGA